MYINGSSTYHTISARQRDTPPPLPLPGQRPDLRCLCWTFMFPHSLREGIDPHCLCHYNPLRITSKDNIIFIQSTASQIRKQNSATHIHVASYFLNNICHFKETSFLCTSQFNKFVSAIWKMPLRNQYISCIPTVSKFDSNEKQTAIRPNVYVFLKSLVLVPWSQIRSLSINVKSNGLPSLVLNQTYPSCHIPCNF